MLCECGRPATFNGRECPPCARSRLGSVGLTLRVAGVEAVSIGEYRRRGMDGTATKRWNERLERYRKARMEGTQPATTRTRDIDAALAASDVLQRPVSTRSPEA